MKFFIKEKTITDLTVLKNFIRSSPKKGFAGSTLWSTPQEDCCEFKLSLAYCVRSCLSQQRKQNFPKRQKVLVLEIEV